MKTYLLAAAAMLPVVAVTPAQAERPGDKIAGSYICVFKANVSRGNAQAEANRSAQRAVISPCPRKAVNYLQLPPKLEIAKCDFKSA